MKNTVLLMISIIMIAVVLTACSKTSQADIDESIALESAQARLAQAESEYESVSESIAEAKEAKASRKDNYTPTDEEKELICGDWYRSADNGEGDTDFYWLTMDEQGYCTFSHETLNTKGYIDDLDGTWSVDDHGFVNIDLGKYSGKFRFLKNSYGSTNIICLDGDDFVESGDDGQYAAFVPVKWYKGNLRFVENMTEPENDETSTKPDKTQSQTVESDTSKTETAKQEEAESKAAESDTAGSETVESEKADTAESTTKVSKTEESVTATGSETSGVTYIEMQGEGDAWFRLAAVDGLCKIDVDTREGEIYCLMALNQNDFYVVKIQQIR